MKQITPNSVTGKQIDRKLVRWLVRGQPPRYKAAIARKLSSGEWPYKLSVAEEDAKIVQTHARVVHRALGTPPNRKLSDGALDRLILRRGGRARLGQDRSVNQAVSLSRRVTTPGAAREWAALFFHREEVCHDRYPIRQAARRAQ